MVTTQDFLAVRKSTKANRVSRKESEMPPNLRAEGKLNLKAVTVSVGEEGREGRRRGERRMSETGQDQRKDCL